MRSSRTATWMILGLASVTMIAHLFVGPAFGFHRDELQTLDDARHLAWGYVAYPPMTPFFGRLSLNLFGISIVGFRFFASLAQAVALILTGLMAREMGGGRHAQLLAAAAYLPFALGAGALMQYVSFDNVCWVLAAYSLVRLLRSEDPRWWLAIGAAAGLGMMAKYAMAFFVAAIFAGFLVTDARRYLASKWLLAGCAVALVIWAPNLAWEAEHQFVSFDFLRSIHARDVSMGRAKGFLPDQLILTIAPLWIMGLIYCLRSPAAKRFRAIGWMYLFLLAAFLAARGRGYYLIAAYPMLYAAGSVWWERRLARISVGRARAMWRIAWAVVTASAVLACVIALPVAPVESAWGKFSLTVSEDLREEIGWKEMVETVAKVRDSLPAAHRGRLAVLTANYGEAGAVDLYGGEYDLPLAISRVNSFGERGYGDSPPETLIVVGFPSAYLAMHFASCRLAARIRNRYGVANMETRSPGIFVCQGLRESWPEFWRELPRYA